MAGPVNATGLIGRDQELATLEGALHGVREGVLTLVTIGGDPGLGKTTLLRYAYRSAHAAGLTVGYGAGSELERDVPLHAAGDALRELLCLDGEITETEQACAALAGAPPRTEHYRRLSTRLNRVEPGFLLCLDDLHWGDDASVDLLEYLLRHPPERAGMLLCTFRPRQLPDRLAAAFRSAHPRWTHENLQLAPLNERDSLALVPAGVAEPQLLHRLAEGNPLYLRALLQLGASSWTGDEPALGCSPSLETVREALGRDLSGLPAEHTELARTAAVLGDPVTTDDLVAVTGWAPRTVSRTVDELLERDLLRPHLARPNQLSFRHPLLRTHLYETAKTEWRRQTHAKVARALHERGESAARRAEHVAQYAGCGDLAAIALLAEAGEEVLHSSPHSAISWARTGLRLLGEDTGPEPALRWRLTLLLAEALRLAGEPDESLALLLRLREEIPAGTETELVTRIVINCAFLHRILGNYRHTAAILEERIVAATENASAAREAPETLSELHTELATVLLMTGQPERALSHLRVSLRLTEHQPRSVHRLSVYATLALIDAYGGSSEHPSRDRCAELVDQAEDDTAARALDALGKLAWAEALTDRMVDAERHFARGARIGRASRQTVVLPYMLTGASYVQLQLGQVSTALETADAAEQTALALGDTQFRGFALALRANALLFHQGATQAAASAGRAVQLVEPRSWWGQVATSVFAKVRVEQGLPAEALDTLTARLPGATAIPSSNGAQWMYTAVSAALAIDDLDAAREWAQAADRSATAFGSRLQHGHAALATALVREREGRLDEAVASTERAIRAFTHQRAELDAIRARLQLSELLLAQDLVAEASRQCTTAKNSAADHQSSPLLRTAIDLERRLAARRPRPDRSEGAVRSLTEREQELAELVGSGLSNQEISERLFLSRKTVETHLTRIYRKLHIRSRSALAAIINDHRTGAGNREP